MKHATITDIAKRLGLSASTVSRALNDHPDIRRETKALVKQVAAELRYSPNPIAQSLKSNRTSTIGVIVPEIKHDFFASVISGIEDVAYHSGYTIILCQSNESVEREVVNTNMLVQHRVAGVLASISQQTRSGEHFQTLLERKIPLVFFDRVCEDVPTHRVVVDDIKSARTAVSFLLERGYKRIAHFAGPREVNICRQRLRGYYDALNAANVEAPENRVFFGGLHEADGYASMDALLKMTPRPDAVFCVNDPVAVGAFQRIKEAGLRIPADIALIGFSNNRISSLLDPPLTTMDQPSFEMGKRAAEILIKLIECEDQTCEAETHVLETKILIRGSA